MSKSLHPLIIFFWGHILFVRVQCRGTLGILNESKLSERKELCFRRCDIGFQADDKETSSKEIFRRRSCYERCLRGEGESKSVKTKRRVFVDEHRSSLFKRIRRDPTSMEDNRNSVIKYGGENCAPGNDVNGTHAMFPTELEIVFSELKGKQKGRYKGIVTWKALQNESVEWTGYKIFIQDSSDKIECGVVPKNVTHYSITTSYSEGSRVYVMVVSSPHLENLRDYFGDINNTLGCIARESYRCGFKPVDTTSPSTVGGRKTSSTSEPVNETVPIPGVRTKPPSTMKVTTAAITASSTSATKTSSSIPGNKKMIAIMIVGIGVGTTVLACGIVGVLQVLKCYRRSRTALPTSTTDEEYEYDAFVIFSSKDTDWVKKTLIPILEKKHALKCCIHYRNFTPGVLFRDNVVNSVYKCRKTVAVVSSHFFNSNYCGSELDFALHRLMEKRDDSLVVIKLDEVDKRKLPIELQERSYIDFSKSVERKEWEKKLVSCLKKKP